MRTALVILGLLLAAPAVASAAPVQLSASVTRVALESPVVVTSATSGATVVERYRKHVRPTSGTPLVVIVRLPRVNSPDTVAVTRARRHGSHFSIAIETRRYNGPLAGNEVTTPYVEVALGELSPGTYTIDVAERIFHFTKLGAPQTATGPRPGLESSISLTVQ